MKSVFGGGQSPKLKGLQSINTLMKRQGQPRSLGEMLNELSLLERKRARLTTEREIWARRMENIDTRLAEIEVKAKSLQQLFAEENSFAQVVEGINHKEKDREARSNEVVIRY